MFGESILHVDEKSHSSFRYHMVDSTHLHLKDQLDSQALVVALHLVPPSRFFPSGRENIIIYGKVGACIGEGKAESL